MGQKSLIEVIQLLHSEMRSLSLWAGINEKRYDRSIKNIDLYTEEELKNIHDWLLDVRWNQYFHLNTVYEMVPPQNWENYVLLGITDLQEQVLMSQAKDKLFYIWKNCYYPERKIIRKVRKENHNGQEKATKQADSKKCSSGVSI